jgi:hypothetical protein
MNHTSLLMSNTSRCLLHLHIQPAIDLGPQNLARTSYLVCNAAQCWQYQPLQPSIRTQLHEFYRLN